MFSHNPLNNRILSHYTIIIALLFSTSGYAEEYPVMTLFKETESGVFHDLRSGKLLKPVENENRTLYLEQDGDIFEEDVATLDDPKLGLRGGFSFSKSKRLLATEVYTDHLFAFYSGCRYRLYKRKFVPVASSCGFKFRKNKSRSERIEWEHVVPAWHFGHQLRCWQNGGRLHCRNTNEQFRQMEADMHNLVPAIGEINGDRSNYKYSIVSGEPRLYGNPINMEIAFQSRVAEPPEAVQGDIARTYFYMMDRYRLQVSKQQKQQFIAWNNMDPVDSWERKKNQRIKSIQGDENKYVTHYKKLKQNDLITSAPDTDFGSIIQSLRERFSFLFDYLPAQIVEGLLLLAALYLLWRSRRKKKAESQQASEKAETIDTPNQSEQNNHKASSQPAYVKIQSVLNKRVLALDDKGQLIVKRSSRAHSQRWQLIPSNQTEGFVFIWHIESGKVLAIADSLKKDDAEVLPEDQKRRSNNHQEWRVNTNEDGEAFIENRATAYVLDITDKKTHDGAAVASHHQKTRSTENQRWIIKPSN